MIARIVAGPVRVLGLSVALLLLGCGGAGSATDTAGPADLSAPEVRDAGTDPGVDAARDLASEAAADALSEATSDVPADVPPDLVVPPTDVITGEVGLGQQPVAGVCATDDDCADGWCVTDYFGGYCSSHCAADDDCSQASVYGSLCLQSPENHQKMCWKVCKAAVDCRSDQFCAGTGALKMCVPKCQPDSCKTGYACDLDSGQCVYASSGCQPQAETCNAADDDCDGLTDEGCSQKPNLVPGVDALDLGYITAGGGGLSHTAAFQVPADAVSFALVAWAADNGALMFWNLTNPTGTGLLNGSDIYASANRTYPGEGATALLVPNNPAVSVAPGTWHFSFYKDGDLGPVSLAALLKRGAEPTSGSLGFNFYFVGLGWINAASAQNNATFQKLVQKLGAVYLQAGITVDQVAYYDITGSDGAKFSNLELADGPADERHQLLQLSAAHPDSPNVNVFFVNDITTANDYSGYFDVLGIAGGIPGPPLFQGINGAGVVVDLSDFQSGWMSSDDKATLYAQVVAHEVGHQLGLFHSTEQSGETHDQLPDTAECFVAHDDDGNGVVDGYECWGSGATNLMFWQATGSVGLSTQQGWVLRRNPAVR